MLTAEYLIIAVAAFAAGLTLGPIIGRQARRNMVVAGLAGLLVGSAVVWPTSRAILIETSIFEAGGLGDLSLDLMRAVFLGIAAVLLPLAFAASVTGP